MKTNYHLELAKLLEEIKTKDIKPRLLLHACCAPCSSYVLEYLSSYFDISIYYYNPNIYPKAEYDRRLSELKEFLQKIPAYSDSIQLIETDYIVDEYFSAVKIKENPELAKEPEKGERCRRCYEFRMKKSYEYAKDNNFDYFCTTLSISPFKDAVKINVIGKDLGSSDSTKWLVSDFKKNAGFLRSLELSSEYGLYRQQYCGCVYSYESRLEADREISK